MYKISDFGRELEEQVNLKYDVEHLANWVHAINMNNYIDFDTGSAMAPILAMEGGDELALSKE